MKHSKSGGVVRAWAFFTDGEIKHFEEDIFGRQGPMAIYASPEKMKAQGEKIIEVEIRPTRSKRGKSLTGRSEKEK